MFKKLLSVLLLVVMVATLAVGCGKGDKPAPGEQKKVYELKLGHNVTPGSDVDLGAIKFKELVEQKTNGQVKVTIFPAAQLGSEIDSVKNMGQGAIDIVIPGDGAFGTYAPKYQALVLPFLFNSIEHMDKAYASDLGKELNAEFEKSCNSSVLAVWHRGARNITAKKPINTPDDLKGMKLRVTTIPIIVDAWKAMGANPTPIAFPELFVSLQQGVVDGQENPLDLIYTSKFQEVQSHVTLTKHTYSPWLFMMNKAKYQSFPADIKKLFDEALTEATAYQHELVKESDNKNLKLLKDAGMIAVEPNRDAFVKKFTDSGVEAKMAEKNPAIPDIIKRIRDLK